MNSVYDDISLIISSCGRFKLLFKTIKSMRPWIHKIPQKIIVEDSGVPEDIPIKKLESMGFTVLVNPERIGQHRSLDIAYAQANQKYIFHCEDDWKFFAEPDIEFVKKVLENPTISCFCFRKSGDRDPCNPRDKRFIYDDFNWKTLSIDNKPFKVPSRIIFKNETRARYQGYNFIPHLAHRKIYEKVIKNFSSFPDETELAKFMRLKGFTIAVSGTKGYCFHTGWRNRWPFWLPPYNTQIIVKTKFLYRRICALYRYVFKK